MKNGEVIGRQRRSWVRRIVSGEGRRESKGGSGGVFVRTGEADAVGRTRVEVSRLEKIWIGGTELEVSDLQLVALVAGANEKFRQRWGIEVGFGGKCGITQFCSAGLMRLLVGRACNRVVFWL